MARTGRPRGFDKGEAVQQAMALFWEHGYEATSLAQLKTAMGGISAASFYAAFGSKEALFRQVVDRYLATHGQVMAPLSDLALPPREAVEQTLRGSARMQTDQAHPFGCLVVLSTSTCSPESRHLQALLAEGRHHNRAAMLACVERAIAAGDLPHDTNAGALAAMFDTFLVGLTAQARDQVPLASLEAAISGLMCVWDGPAKAGPRTQGAPFNPKQQRLPKAAARCA